MSASLRDANEAILSRRFPGLLQRIAAEVRSSAEPLELILHPGIRGDPTLTANGKWVHSRVDPRREAERLAAGAGGSGPVVVLGFGLGYAAEAASAAYPDRPLVIAEKDARVLDLALDCRDLRGLLSRERLAFAVGGNGSDLAAALDGSGGSPALLSNRALRELSPAWYDEAENAVRAWASKDDVNAATLKRFGTRWVRNLVRNLDSVRDAPGVARLAGRFPGVPVLLVAAGPSLDEVLPLLPALSRRCLVVAVDTSLRAVLGAGVDPDFAVVVDPQYWNARHLDRCPAPRTALIAESAVYPSAAAAPFARLFLCSSLFPLGRFVEDGVDPKGALGAGGSVATTAWDFARLLGPGPMWAAGLDLAFPGLKTHFKGALFEERVHAEARRVDPGETRSFKALRDGFPFSAPSAEGGVVLTDRRLSLYAAWFESRFRRHPESAPRGLSAKGLRIAGIETDAPGLLLSLPDRRAEIDERLAAAYAEIDAAFAAERGEREAAFSARVRALAEGLAEIARISERAAAAAAAALSSPQPEAAFSALEEANARIAASAVKDAAGFLFPRIEEIEAELPPAVLDPLERHLELSRRLYGKLREAALFNAVLLKKRFK